MKKDISEEKKIRIAYLAPEIPALSATFVYLEILKLEEKGFDITPISVHVPGMIAREKRATVLHRKTEHLYSKTLTVFIRSFFLMARCRPKGTLRAAVTAIHDVLKMLPLSLRISIGLIYRLFVAFEVARMLEEKKCCHIHVHFAHIPSDIAMYAAMIVGIGFSFTSHANDLFQRGYLLKEKVERARFAVTISEHNRFFLKSRGAKEKKIHVIHCGVDAALFAPVENRKLEKIPKLGTLCRLVEKKGIDDLIRAAHLLKEKGTPFHLYIAGDGPLKHSLIDLKAQLGLEEHVTFMGSLVHDEVPDWLLTLDLFVLPCKKDRHGDMDGIPVVLMEAMLMGTLVVSTRVSGIPELIEHNRTGLLCEPSDVNGLSRVLIDAISKRADGRGFYDSARELISREFDLEKNVSGLAGLLQKEIPCR